MKMRNKRYIMQTVRTLKPKPYRQVIPELAGAYVNLLSLRLTRVIFQVTSQLNSARYYHFCRAQY